MSVQCRLYSLYSLYSRGQPPTHGLRDSWTPGLLDAGCRREGNRQEDADAGFVKMIFLKKRIVL